MMPPVIHETATEWRVAASTYQLVVQKRSPRARLSDASGVTWTDLSLLASVHRTDMADESMGPVSALASDVDGVASFRFPRASSAWNSKEVVLEARSDAVHLRVEVAGSGRLDSVLLCGGDATTESGACGRFRSSIGFQSLFTPGPTDPVQVVRPATSGATLGVVGDAEPGRLHGIFSPPPLTFAVSRTEAPQGEGAATAVPQADWLAIGVLVDVVEAGFTHVSYQPLDGGWVLGFEYEGHTSVTDTWRSPSIRIVPTPSPWAAIEDYRDQVVQARATTRAGTAEQPTWWLEPIFCGWGSQCARAATINARPDPGLIGGAAAISAPSLARQDLYDEWLARLASAGAVPGTVVIDDRWQEEYGTCEVDTTKWPDLRGWIDSKHAVGQRVLLWFKAWDPGGLPRDECIVDANGHPVAADPSSPAYLARLTRIVHYLLSPEGLNADGFKVDFTQRAPSGRSLRSAGDKELDGGPWGISLLHRLMTTIYEAAKAAKPDALVINHTVDPGFSDVTDMIRLNDILERDPSGARVGVVEQLRFRAAVARSAVPSLPIDTDQWPMPNRTQWLAYVEEQPSQGVPAVYYTEFIDGSGEELTTQDLQKVALSWERYRDGLRRG